MLHSDTTYERIRRVAPDTANHRSSLISGFCRVPSVDSSPWRAAPAFQFRIGPEESTPEKTVRVSFSNVTVPRMSLA